MKAEAEKVLAVSRYKMERSAELVPVQTNINIKQDDIQ
jgi:hypothetical protein